MATRQSRATRKKKPKELALRQKRVSTALAALPDDRIDTSDIAELPASAWKNAIRGKFYRQAMKS
jgi:hypothetical protein